MGCQRVPNVCQQAHCLLSRNHLRSACELLFPGIMSLCSNGMLSYKSGWCRNGGIALTICPPARGLYWGKIQSICLRAKYTTFLGSKCAHASCMHEQSMLEPLGFAWDVPGQAHAASSLVELRAEASQGQAGLVQGCCCRARHLKLPVAVLPCKTPQAVCGFAVSLHILQGSAKHLELPVALLFCCACSKAVQASGWQRSWAGMLYCDACSHSFGCSTWSLSAAWAAKLPATVPRLNHMACLHSTLVHADHHACCTASRARDTTACYCVMLMSCLNREVSLCDTQDLKSPNILVDAQWRIKVCDVSWHLHKKTALAQPRAGHHISPCCSC